MQPARRFLVSRMGTSETYNGRYLRADVSKYRPEVYKSEKSKILKKNPQSSTT